MRLLQIKNISVIGAGIMGHGIGQAFALGGYEVTLNDISDQLLNKALQQIRSNLDTFVEFGITTSGGAEEALSRIKINKNLKEAAGESDFVVEALPEVMDLKKSILKELDEHCPPHIIPVVEIVKGQYTSDQTFDLVYQLLLSIGKKPVKILKEVPGFLGNRLQFALYREALYCLKEGIASAEDIDMAVKGSYGFRLPTLPPSETIDFGGLDTYLHIAEYLFKEIDRSTEPPEILIEKVKQEKLGVKSGEGFFLYPPGKKEERIKERDRQFLQRLKCLYFRNPKKED